MISFLSRVAACGLGAVLLLNAESKVEYGRYLAEEVARCQDCHTQKSEKGELDKSKWMKGATLDFQATAEIPRWHKTSPDLTPSSKLWQRWGEAGVLKYLQTGLTPKGTKADPPMPTYTFKPADAEAIFEYLKSLK